MKRVKCIEIIIITSVKCGYFNIMFLIQKLQLTELVKINNLSHPLALRTYKIIYPLKQNKFQIHNLHRYITSGKVISPSEKFLVTVCASLKAISKFLGSLSVSMA